MRERIGETFWVSSSNMGETAKARIFQVAKIDQLENRFILSDAQVSRRSGMIRPHYP